MKNYITTALVLFCIAAFIPKSDAQILKKLEKKIERKVNQRIDRKTDKAIDQGLDKVEDHMEEKSDIGDKGSANYALSKFDFVPGDKVLFSDDFNLEAKGDFPVRWNTNGSGEMVTLEGLEGTWLRVPDNTISFPELKTALPENFTVEFDLFYPAGTTRPPVTFGFTEVADPAKSSIQHIKIFYFHI